MKNFFWSGASWEKGGQFLEGDSGFLEIAIINFTSWLFDLLFTCRLKGIVSPAIFHYVLSLFRFIKIFVNIALL